MAHSLRVYGDGVSFQLSLASHLARPDTWSDLGSFLVVGVSQPRWISAPRILEVDHLLPPRGPSQILPVGFQGSTVFLIGPPVRR